VPAHEEANAVVTLGIMLVIAGAAAIVIEAHLPTGGIIAVLGAICAATGFGVAISASGAALWVTLPVAIVFGVGALTLVAIGAAKTRSALREKVSTGPERLIGAPASVCTWSGLTGQVAVAGAVWTAQLDPGWDALTEPAPGETLIIEKRDGLTLTVRPQQFWELGNS
jgi:membrane-bound ClpP family serine protease